MKLQPLNVSPEWEQSLERWTKVLVVQGRAPRTVTTRIRHLRQFARECEVSSPLSITEDVLINWAATKQWAPETRHAYYTSIRLFFQWLSRKHGWDRSPAECLTSIHRPVPPPRPVPDEVLRAALQATTSVRDELILELAGLAGLRCVEIAQIHRKDLIRDLQWDYALTVHGKGGRYRVVPLSAELFTKIERVLTNSDNGFLFPGDDHGHLSPLWISKRGAKLLPGKWTMHTLRHRFATSVYWHSGHDILLTRDLLGHASVDTTMRYAAIDSTEKKNVISKIQLD